MFKKSTITLVLILIGSVAVAQDGLKMKFDEPDDIYWDNRFGGIGANGFIRDVAHATGDSIFIAGDFTQINGVLAPGVALWTGSEWQAVPPGNKTTTDVYVSDIEYVDGMLFILNQGTTFANFDERYSGRLLRYDTSTEDFYLLNDTYYYSELPNFNDMTQTEDGQIILSSIEVIYNDTTEYNINFHSIFSGSLIYTLGPEIAGNTTLPYLKEGKGGSFITFPIDGDLKQSLSTIENPQLVEISISGSYSTLNNGSVFQDIGMVEFTGNYYLAHGTQRNQTEKSFAKYDISSSTWNTNTNFYGTNDILEMEAIHDDTVYMAEIETGIYADDDIHVRRYDDELYSDSKIFYNDLYFFDVQLFPYKNGVVTAGVFKSYDSNEDKYVLDIGILSTEQSFNSIKGIGQAENLMGLNGFVQTMIEVGDSLIVGGNFDMAGNTYTSNIAVLSDNEWSSIGFFGSEVSLPFVNHMYRYDKYIFVGGLFDEIYHNGVSYYSKNIAAYNMESDSWEMLGTGVDGDVSKIQKIENNLYALVNDQGKERLWTYRSGYWFDRIYAPDYRDLSIYADDIIAKDDKLFIAGEFYIDGIKTALHAATLSIEGLQKLNMPIDVDINHFGTKFSIVDNKVIMAVTSRFIENSEGSYPILPLFEVVGDTVESFLASPSNNGFLKIIGGGDRLFAFTSDIAGSEGFNGISTWNGDSWTRLGSGLNFKNDFINYGFYVGDAIITSDGKLAVGGYFDMAGNKPASNFTFWSGETAPSTPQTISFKNTPVIDYAESLTFVWSNASYSTAFEFELSEDPDFNSLVVGLTGISENEVEVRTEFRLGTPYYWRVRAVNPNGYSAWSEVATFEMAAPVSTEEFDSIQQFELLQNYPNPFNPSTNIQFSLPEAHNIKLEIFDVSGRKVATLFNGERLGAGSHTTTFRADNLSSGVYFYRLEAGTNIQIKKMLLIK